MLLRRDRAIIAILIVADVAFHANRNNTVSAADISKRTELPKRSIEPILQLLSRANILESTRGPRGGYHLCRPKKQITLKDIVCSISVKEKEKYDDLAFPLYQQVIKPYWDDLDQKTLERISKTTLQDLVEKAEKSGMKRPRPLALSFSI
ncbi:MAG: RrF2 family transcriptional regulator [Commensalibacter sp.]